MNLTGRTVGKYKLLERLGQGGMAQVYKAQQPTIERPVAIKILHSHLAESSDFIARFKREARGLGQLQHPNIVQVIDFDVEGDLYFMVVDYIPGQTLREYLDARGALPYDEALRITAQLADALAYAHQKGAIHRDIKPGNVLFRDATNTSVVLTDFGISRLMNDATLTATGAIVGTPAYMSPEAVLGQRVDQRTDIFSLGIILYEMVTGRVPYTGDTPMSVILKQLNEPLPSPRDLRPDLPESLVQLIEKALAKDPAERFQSAEEFLAAILTVLPQIGGNIDDTATFRTLASTRDFSRPPSQVKLPTPTSLPGTVPPPATPTPTPAPLAPIPGAPARKRGRLFAAAGMLVVLLLAAGVWMSVGNRSLGLIGAAPTGTATADPTATATITIVPTATAEPTAIAAIASTATTTPQPTATAAPPPLTTPGQIGMLHIADSETTRASNFTLNLDRVAQPPAGSHYELWIETQEGNMQRLGALPIHNSAIVFSGNVDTNLVSNVRRVLVSIEPDGNATSPQPAPTGAIVFTGELPDSYSAALRPVLVDGSNDTGFLISAQEQAALANQHALFSLDALEQNNLAEAQNHAEHVVNILDGKTGSFFGDLNLDGQVQNPGDDVGVRAYLEESQQELETALADTPTADRQQALDQATTAIDGSLARVASVIDNARKLNASDTIEEARPFGAAMKEHLNALLGDATNPETIAAAYNQALVLAAIPLLTTQKDLAPPDALADTTTGRVGTFRVSSNATTRGGSFLLQLAQMTPPPAGAHYDVWLIHATGDARLFLGQLNFTTGYAFLQGNQAQNLLETYDRLIVSLETTTANLRPSDTIVFEGTFASNIEPEITQLMAATTPDGKGVLFGAEEQLRAAMQHRQFAQESLAAGDLAEAQRHTEHTINILAGEEGPHFGDLNFDGQAQNPGDGVGVYGYLQTSMAVMEDLVEREDVTGNQRFYANQVSTTSDNRLTMIDAAIEQGLKVFASDTAAEAGPFLGELDQFLNALMTGEDTDGNGVIDPLAGEGGILVLQDLTLGLNEVAIFPVETSADAPDLFFSQSPHFEQVPGSNTVPAQLPPLELPPEFLICQSPHGA